MGTIIKATGVSTDGSVTSSIENGYIAAEDCLARASIDRQDIDLIINVGVYRDSNLFEPSVAILIQKKLGISLGYSEKKHVLSFDLMNGSCGLLYAAQTVDAIFRNSGMRRALIISSDAHPSAKKVDGFPYNHAGAAMLLEWNDDDTRGFQNFSFRTSENGFKGVESHVDTQSCAGKGRESITVTVDNNYADELTSFTAECIKEHMKSAVKNNRDIKAFKLVTTQPTCNFNARIAASIGVPSTLSDATYAKYGDTHSSSLCIAYHEAVTTGLLEENDTVLFCASSAGLTVGTVLYNNAGGRPV